MQSNLLTIMARQEQNYRFHMLKQQSLTWFHGFVTRIQTLIVVHYIAYRIKIRLDEAPQFVDNFLALASFEVSILNGTVK